MNPRNQVTAGQFFSAGFLARTTVTLALSAPYAAAGGFPGGAVSAALAMGASLLLGWPALSLYKRRPEHRLGRLAAAGYLGYFVVMGGVSLGLFRLFLREARAQLPEALVLAAVAAAGAYGAHRGLEAVARAGWVALWLFLAGAVAVSLLVLPRFRVENIGSLPQWRGVATGALVFLSRSTMPIHMGVLLPWVKGRKGAGFAAWALGTGVFLVLLLGLLAGCLGPYAWRLEFPVYALAACAPQRLEAVFLALWSAGLTVNAAMDLTSCRACLGVLGGKKPWLWAAAAGMVLVGMAFGREGLGVLLAQPGLWLALTLCAALLPFLGKGGRPWAG